MNTMAETTPNPPGTPANPPGTITDHRRAPRGVLPRGVQTWVMAGLAGGIVLVILIAGRPQPPARPTAAPTAAATPSADRVRDYQERLRALELQALQEEQSGESGAERKPAPSTDSRSERPRDPLADEKKRRDYESLFASTVIARTRDEDRRDSSHAADVGNVREGSQSLRVPSIDEVAEAVVRATGKAGANAPAVVPQPAASAEQGKSLQTNHQSKSESSLAARRADDGRPIDSSAPLQRILEGTVLDTVLTNRLENSGPVNCLVTNPLYSYDGQRVVIPAGARVLGEAKAVQGFGETRLAVAFHRVLMPDGRSYSLDQFPGMNQIGDAGLRDRVNQHYWSTFGAAAAVGLVSGLGQALTAGALSGGNGDRTIVITGGVADATAQTTAQVMNRFLNRLPTVTIREGQRVKVYLTSDLELPSYEPAVRAGSF